MKITKNDIDEMAKEILPELFEALEKARLTQELLKDCDRLLLVAREKLTK